MPNTFFAADHHLQHKNVLTFRDEQSGKFLRSFDDIEAHDQHIIKRHNLVVKPEDTVYMMGDILWHTNKQSRSYLDALNGKLVLIGGNHDDLRWLWNTGRFDNIFLWKYMPDENMILSHVPLNEEDLKRTKFNLHGHIHQKQKTLVLQGKSILLDPRYLCVSMEQIEYTPIDLGTVQNMLTNRMNTFQRIIENARTTSGETSPVSAGGPTTDGRDAVQTIS